MKLRQKIWEYICIVREDPVQRYNVIKAALVILLVIFIAAQLSANKGSDRSAEEVAGEVVPELIRSAEGEQPPQPSPDSAAEIGSYGQFGTDSEEAAPAQEAEIPEGTPEESGVFDGMGQADALDFKRIFGLNAEDYDSAVYFKPLSQMDVEELLIVRVKSEDQMEELEEAVEDRIRKQKTSFDGYGAAQCALLEKAIVKGRGNFLFYCVSPEAEKRCDAFLHAL